MNFYEIEKKILNFWKTNQIFEKSLTSRRGRKTFVFYEGPPTANGLPHIGHFLGRAYKDIILRFRTMIGNYVPRRAGWDTHGLPVEVEVEKQLNFKSKKNIEEFGIAKFNSECQKSVWRYKKEWEEMTRKMGFWLDLEDAYITYDPYYIESLWWMVKQFWKKGLLKKQLRVFPWCPRCGTVLSQAELGMPDAYQKIEDPSVYLKFKIINGSLKDNYLLVWTTTPWTLLANVALAIHPEFNYYRYRFNDEIYISNKPIGSLKEKIDLLKGEKLIGLKYQPLFPLANQKNKSIYKVYPAEFVSFEEGTGIVHIAPAYGEDDLKLAKAYNLPIIHIINKEGLFDFDNPPELKDKLNGLFFKEGDKLIIEELKNKNLLFHQETYFHEYPHCWRCKNPLIYYADENWIVEVSKINHRLIANNKKINWIPDHLKEGRFGQWLKEEKDWNFSRSRYWGTPLPIWECQKCKKQEVIGSLKELSKKQTAKNIYYLMRHGEAVSNVKNIVSSHPEKFFNPLTEKGIKQIKRVIPKIKRLKIDLIVASPLLRTKTTAELIAQALGIEIIFDERLKEVDFGNLNGANEKDFERIIQDQLTQYRKAPAGGETLNQVRLRMIQVIIELEKKYAHRKILIISHGDPLWTLAGEMLGLSPRQTANSKSLSFKLGQIKKIPYLSLPRNPKGELDLHRPYVDYIFWKCKCGGTMKRIPEVIDVWFDSGAVPFAMVHYPFENKHLIDKQKFFPADYICEGVDQTRGWFYTLLVVSTILKNKPAYKNVVSLNLVLDKFGRKMSKSLGNVVDPREVIEKYGADALRMYFYSLSAPGEAKRYDEEALKKFSQRFTGLILNILNFYKTYSDPYPKIKPEIHYTLIDKWFLLRIRQTTKEVEEKLKAYDIFQASRSVLNLLDDFSRWWLRRSRQRFQFPESDLQLANDLKIFEEFLYYFAIICAPFAPFISEYLFQEIKKRLTDRFKVPESIHLTYIPKFLPLSLQDKEILMKMALIRELASKISKIRKELKISVRYPLKELFISKELEEEYLEILKNETNIKNIYLGEPMTESLVKEDLQWKGEQISFWLNPELSIELKKEGIVNEFIRYIQHLRKEANCHPKDKTIIYFQGPKNLQEIFENDKKKILNQTRSVDLIFARPQNFLAEKECKFEEFGMIKIFIQK